MNDKVPKHVKIRPNSGIFIKHVNEMEATSNMTWNQIDGQRTMNLKPEQSNCATNIPYQSRRSKSMILNGKLNLERKVNKTATDGVFQAKKQNQNIFTRLFKKTNSEDHNESLKTKAPDENLENVNAHIEKAPIEVTLSNFDVVLNELNKKMSKYQLREAEDARPL